VSSRSLSDLTRRYLAPTLRIREHEFAWGARTYVMGIINVTPDSFSGDGIGPDPKKAAALARAMEAAGADWLDIGGESSRPGAQELDPATEARRVVPCIEAVRAATSLPLSVDTYHASVAKRALAAGADAVNDIWGLRRDPKMAMVVAESGAALIAMHNQRGRSPGNHAGVIGDIRDGLSVTLAICRAHGIASARIILDPGFGFGWTPEQNLQMIRELPALHALGYPLLVGVSRKSTIGHALGDVPAGERIIGTAAAVALSTASGADIVRVHDVAEMVQAARVSDAIVRGPGVGRGPVAIALGSNLGDRAANLRAAVNLLEERGVHVTARSSIWETEPIPADQPAFLNAVVTVETSHPPEELLAVLKRIEQQLGRRPERRWGPRPIDLDILFYSDQRLLTDELKIPHERILERNFVLAPLAEVMPGMLPIVGVTASEALGKVGEGGLRRAGAL
jgi:dihydropteroate synthase